VGGAYIRYNTTMSKAITIETDVASTVTKVWACWTDPVHIVEWTHASDDWECTRAENDLRVGGRFVSTLGAKDKSVSFDFGGVYTVVVEGEEIAYTMDDGRTVRITFEERGDHVHITETFEMEGENSEELQRGGWQAILDNFKAHVEAHGA
jgi:uncharacterized protein YndB with AHSA1/START domain